MSEGLKYVGMTIDELRAATGASQKASGDFSIGSAVWPGISKLVEEAGEVMQVCGKLIGSAGIENHWDGSNLRDELEKELADLMAAVAFVVATCRLDQNAINERLETKAGVFVGWHMNNMPQ